MDNDKQPRNKSPRQEGGRYAWQTVRALESIDNCSGVTNRTRAKIVYVALTWISAEHDFSPTFETSQGLIAHKASLSTRTVYEALPELEAAKVVCIERRFIKDEKQYDVATYTLLTFGQKDFPTQGKKNLPTGSENNNGDNLLNCLNTPVRGVSDKEDSYLKSPSGADARKPKTDEWGDPI